jgi:hypothetical protein
VILLGVGLFYAMLGIGAQAGRLGGARVLVLGGVYLGFFERAPNARAGFRWMKRARASPPVAGGIFIVATTPARGIVFRDGTWRSCASPPDRGAGVRGLLGRLVRVVPRAGARHLRELRR